MQGPGARSLLAGLAGLVVGAGLVAACGGADRGRADAGDEGPGSPAPGPAEAALEAARGSRPDASADSGAFTGLYVYLADAALFTECGTHRGVPVAGEGAAAELERRYLLARSGPGEPVRVTVEGRVATRPSMEGAPGPHLLVDRVVRVTREPGCPGDVVDLSLTGTRWQLTQVGDTDVETSAWMELERDGRRVTVQTGCREVTGTFDVSGPRLRFGSLASRSGACAGPAAELDRSLLEALRVTGSFRIVGAELDLIGELGPVARFGGG